MSATNRGGDRQPDDFYATPAWCTRAILNHMECRGDGLSWGTVFDPCAGEGAILDVAAKVGGKTRRHATKGLELDPGRAAVAASRGHNVRRQDALATSPWEVPAEGIVLTNPPYGLAMEFVQRALSECPKVAMLLRLPWLASEKRSRWLRKNTPAVCVLSKRPSFCISVKCVAGVAPVRACRWQQLLPVSADRPKACPECGMAVRITTSDSTDYAWMLWGFGPANLTILESQP